MIGQTLQEGRYEILDRIGQGGFSTVYRARDTKLERDVAVKILRNSETGRDFKALLQRESQWMAGFKHQHIVTVFDIDEHEGQPYLVMELVDGLSLHDLVSKTILTPDEVCDLALQIVQAMAHSHAKGIVHRDLTLRNILVEVEKDERSVVKILDFGLAKILNESMTMTMTMMGTPTYLPPEVINGQPADGRADIFAFGVCLFRMLNGYFPFESEHPTATMYLICNEENIEFQADVPAPMRDLILHCLEKDPQARPASFSQLVSELQVLHDQGFNCKTNAPPSAPAIVKAERGFGQRNPYLNRVMIKDQADFFGREREIRKIYSRLDAPHPQSISIVGERRIGKSSLLNHIYNRANREQAMGNHADSIFVYMDFQSRTEFDIPKFIEFLFSVFRYENRSIPIPTADHQGLDLLQQTVRALHDQGKRILILMDEFERITKNPAFDESFFSFLRSLANSYRVAYVTSSCDELQNMCHNKDISDSPFFNIFSNLPLRPFTAQVARRLIDEPSREAGVPLAGYESRILELAGYFPFFLQIACSCVYEALLDCPGSEPDWAAVTSIFLDEVLPHFEFIWEQMEEPEKENLFRVVGGEKISRKYEFVNENLLRRGFLISSEDEVNIFARTFHDFILQKQRSRGAKKGFRGFWKRR